MTRLRKARLFLPLLAAFALTLSVTSTTLAAAVTSTTRTTVPFSRLMLNPCTGEQVGLSGTLLLINHTTLDDSGGVHSVFILVPQQVRGVSLATGSQYKAVGGDRVIFNSNGATDFTHTDEFILVSQGGTDNLLILITEHITLNAKGVLTAEVSNFEIKCVG